MKVDADSRTRVWLGKVLNSILQPSQAVAATTQIIGQLTRQGLAVFLSAMMVMVPMGQGDLSAQSPPAAPPPATDNTPQAQPLSADQLDQLVAPIALYPDALVAQVLAASTYPTQVVEADRWRQSQGNAAPEQIAAGADARAWDPSVKALTAFPTVLAQMDKNLQWTTDLGNAYYNQPQDVMDAVQAMRQKAQSAGQLRSTPQQTVTVDNGAIAIVPADPAVVYVPVYNPWSVWGGPIAVYPGFYWAAPPGIVFGGFGIGFGLGIGIGVFGGYGWGYGHWGMGWHDHSVFYNHGAYFSHSNSVVNRGFNRPGGPGRGFGGGRGAYGGGHGAYGGGNRGGFNRAGGGGRPGGAGGGRPGMSRPGGAGGGRSGVSRPGGAGGGHPGGGAPRANGGNTRAGNVRPGGGGVRSGASGGGHPGGGGARPGASGGARPSGGGARPSASGGGHPGGGGGHPGGGGARPSGGGARPSGGGARPSSGGGHPSGGGGARPSGGGGHPGGGGGGHPSGGGGGGKHR